MADLRATPIQPLDVILFRGVDAVSRAICFMEQRMLGRGDFSHTRLGLSRPEFDPHLAAPVAPLLHPEGFAEPVYLEVPERGDAVDAP